MLIAILVVGGIVLLAIAFMVLPALQSSNRSVSSSDRKPELEANGPPDAVFQRIARSVGRLRNFTVVMSGPQTVLVTRRQIPVWAIVLAIILFPVGLIALVARKETSLTLTLRDRGDETTAVTMDGVVSPKLWDALGDALYPDPVAL